MFSQCSWRHGLKIYRKDISFISSTHPLFKEIKINFHQNEIIAVSFKFSIADNANSIFQKDIKSI